MLRLNKQLSYNAQSHNIMLILHFVVGIWIGLSSNEWFVHLVVPFLWGGACCIYSSLYKQEEFQQFVNKGERLREKKHLSQSPIVFYYLSIYIPATAIALVGSFGSAFVLKFLQWE